jgi:hypothetical protein
MNQHCPSAVAANRSEISCLAFQLWEKAGCPEGRDLEFWLGAETQLLAAQKPGAVKVETVAAKPSPAKRVLRVESSTARQPVPRF